MLVLTDEQVQSLLPLPSLIDALTYAFRDDYAKFNAPVRTRLEDGNRFVLLMPCQAEGAIGIKTLLLEARSGRGPAIYSSSYTFHSLDGEIAALMEASVLTELRTAATSAVATRALAPETAHTLGIFGTGVIAKVHVAALLEVRTFERLLVCGSTPEKSRTFAQKLGPLYGISADAVDADTCAAESSVICTCTTSPVPLFRGSVLRPGTHINAVGAFSSQTRELDSDAIVRSRVVVDTFAGAMAEAGEVLQPLAEGRIHQEHILADLHTALQDPRSIRRSDGDITVFKSLGCALEDLVAARLVLTQYFAGQPRSR
jgi:ornithine cyclodeaminase/alanine dehydrogenase-like protein (mu-crystallin family)